MVFRAGRKTSRTSARPGATRAPPAPAPDACAAVVDPATSRAADRADARLLAAPVETDRSVRGAGRAIRLAATDRAAQGTPRSALDATVTAAAWCLRLAGSLWAALRAFLGADSRWDAKTRSRVAVVRHALPGPRQAHAAAPQPLAPVSRDAEAASGRAQHPGRLHP